MVILNLRVKCLVDLVNACLSALAGFNSGILICWFKQIFNARMWGKFSHMGRNVIIGCIGCILCSLKCTPGVV